MKTRLGMLLMALSLVLIGINVGWAQTPVKGGTFVFGRGADSVGLDPAVVTDGESFRVTRNIYESLLEYKRDSTEIVAGLAEILGDLTHWARVDIRPAARRQVSRWHALQCRGCGIQL